MEIVLTIARLLAGALLLTFLIVIHELGHFLVAKRNGVEVEEFGVGFPPKVWGRKLGRGIMECYYTVNALPLGGFVKLKGENSEDKRPGSFGAASLWVKTKITMAGVFVNLIAAVLLISIVAAIRLPVLVPNQYTVSSDTTILRDEVIAGMVLEDSPAAQAGIEPEDVLLRANSIELEDDEQFRRILEQNAGQAINVAYYDQTKFEVVEAKLDLNTSQQAEEEVTVDGVEYLKGYSGAGVGHIEERRSTWSAPIVGIVVSGQLIAETFNLLGDFFGQLMSGQVDAAASGIAGPVGIFVLFTQISQVHILLLMAGVISLSLGIMNALPIPALDGGRLAVTALFEVINKPLTEDLENAIHGTGMALLLILIALITFSDIRTFFF